VVAVVAFGDPGNRGPNIPSPLEGITFPFPASYANKLKENCAQGDPICSFSGANFTAHLSYGTSSNYIEDSANFIFNEYQTRGNSGPSVASFGRPGADPATSPTAANIAAIIALSELLGGPTTPQCPV
jgi:hypothetical protein